MKKVLVCGKSDGCVKYVISKDGEPFCEGSFSDSHVNGGDVFRGVVREHLSQTKAYFVDIGDERTSYLESERFRTGDKGIFQVKVPAYDTKGALLSEDITFPGIYSVVSFTPEKKNKEQSVSFSTKISSKKIINSVYESLERDGLTEPIGSYFTNIMVRTGVLEDNIENFINEVVSFRKRLNEIITKSTSDKENSLYKISFCEHILSRYRHFDYDRILTDDAYLEADIKSFARVLQNEIEIERKCGHFGIFDVDEGSSKLKRYTGHKIMLKSGAWITVDKTEAMYVFDVNSGSAKGTNLEINMEAAEAIMRVVTIRNLSGILMCDFINMKEKDENDILTNYLRDIAKEDYSFVRVYGMTKLGIMEISRKRL